ncbi:hypothetical protein RTBOTA2_001815, partial [Rhodotorula toruloides]
SAAASACSLAFCAAEPFFFPPALFFGFASPPAVVSAGFFLGRGSTFWSWTIMPASFCLATVEAESWLCKETSRGVLADVVEAGEGAAAMALERPFARVFSASVTLPRQLWKAKQVKSPDSPNMPCEVFGAGKGHLAIAEPVAPEELCRLLLRRRTRLALPLSSGAGQGQRGTRDEQRRSLSVLLLALALLDQRDSHWHCTTPTRRPVQLPRRTSECSPTSAALNQPGALPPARTRPPEANAISAKNITLHSSVEATEAVGLASCGLCSPSLCVPCLLSSELRLRRSQGSCNAHNEAEPSVEQPSVQRRLQCRSLALRLAEVATRSCAVKVRRICTSLPTVAISAYGMYDSHQPRSPCARSWTTATKFGQRV